MQLLVEKKPDLAEKFSCNSDEGDCMLEKCSLFKSSETINDVKFDSSDTDSSSANICSSSQENSDNVTFDRWQIVKKKITNSKVDVTFKGAAEMFKDDIKTL